MYIRFRFINIFMVIPGIDTAEEEWEWESWPGGAGARNTIRLLSSRCITWRTIYNFIDRVRRLSLGGVLYSKNYQSDSNVVSYNIHPQPSFFFFILLTYYSSSTRHDRTVHCLASRDTPRPVRGTLTYIMIQRLIHINYRGKC